MRKIYDDTKNEAVNTESKIAVDEAIERKFGNVQLAYNEGFAASSGVSGQTAETGGHVQHPEKLDNAQKNSPEKLIDEENAGLADN